MQVATTADLKIHPRLNLPWLLTADPAQTMLSAKLTADEHVTPVPKTARCETAQRYSLAAADWQLAYLSDASFTRIDSYAGINSENNFNGILGQPNVAVGFAGNEPRRSAVAVASRCNLAASCGISLI